MKGTLMKSVSGIRGIVGDTMTPELIVQVSNAFARYVKRKTVVIGRDSRCTGEAVMRLAESALSMSGCNVVNIGIVPTPTVQLMVEELKAAGGIVISASHNPIEWNAFKLIGHDGSFLNSKEIAKLFELMEAAPQYVPWDKMGKLYQDDTSFGVHLSKVLKLVDVPAIRKKKFKVVLDSVNGAGSYITRDLLEKLGCTIVPLYCDITGTFPRIAEPLPENLKDLAKAVKKHKADIGIAQDPDADRLAIVDNNGNPIGEEYTLTLVADHLLAKKSGPVVVNLSTTKAVEDVAIKYNSPFFRSKVGEINVVDLMKAKKARIGGEGNGGVISPEVHLGRDSLAGIVYILAMMTERKKSISELKKDMPQYVMKKGKVSFDSSTLNRFYAKLKFDFSNEKITDIDGVRIDFISKPDFKGGWVHLRASNTEPIFRIITEGRDKKQAEEIYSFFEKMIRTI